tara:strand:+ start:172 stop:627 length:456 start_codon:yes stop_codon:yes gene_type:complete
MFNRIKQKINEGFTLVEILIVVVIIGILAAVAVPVYLGYVEKSRGSEAEIYIDSIFKQAGIFYTNVGRVPTSLDEMKEENLFSLDPKAELTWVFDLSQLELPSDDGQDSGGLRGKISATSTAEMSGGEGKIVEYDAQTGEFCGYGHKECSN